MSTLASSVPVAKRVGLWRRLGRLALWIVLLVALAVLVANIALFLMRTPVSTAGNAKCLALQGRTAGSGKIVAVDAVSGGPRFSWKLALIGVPIMDMPPSCRVTLVLSPVPGSKIGAEVWLPEQGWTGRLQSAGNGGLAGSIDDISLTVGLQRRYAASSTDTGHVAADDDADWTFGNPVAVADYGWRAIHETAVAAKQVVTLFYGRPPRYSYFGSGSNGGRQGLIEAQRYPEDYDGILAGAPALDVSGGLSTWAWLQAMATKTPSGWLDGKQLAMVNRAALDACDGIDGVTDGIIENPPSCHFQPRSLLCSAARSKDCLTPAQVSFLDAIYRGPTGGDDAGFARGGELGWANWITGGARINAERNFTRQYIGKLVLGRRDWDVDKFDLTHDRAMLDRVLASFNAVNPDLSRFYARGGKLIIYHGWSDPALPPSMAIDYFQAMRAKMGVAKVADFARLYMVPGLDHVIGGPGPNAFGQLAPAGRASPARDMGAALEAWVEHGVAPGAIVASKYSSYFKPLITQSGTPSRTRPLCPYPGIAHWRGKGDTNDARNFACVVPTPAQ